LAHSTPPSSESPWGSDILDPPPESGIVAPYTLDLVRPKRLVGCTPQDRHIGALSNDAVWGRIVRELGISGFRVTRSGEVSGKLTGYSVELTPGFIFPAYTVLSERNLRFDRTISMSRRKRSIIFGIAAVGLAVLPLALFLSKIVIAGIEVLGILFLALASFGVAIYSLSRPVFWSEIICINYGTRKSTAGDNSPLGGDLELRTLRAWSGVARTENWWSRVGHGRAIRQIFQTRTLDVTLNGILDRICENVSELHTR
jgi:hypothetical protein